MASIRTVCWNTQKNSNCSGVIFQTIFGDGDTRVVFVLEPGNGVAGGAKILAEDEATPAPGSRNSIIGRRIDSAGTGGANENVLILWDNNLVNVESIIDFNNYVRQNIANRVPIAVKISTRDHGDYAENFIAGWHAPTDGSDIYSVLTPYLNVAPSNFIQVVMGDFNTEREDGFGEYRLVSPPKVPTIINSDGTLGNAYDKTISNLPDGQVIAGRYYGDKSVQNDLFQIPPNFRALSDHVPIYTSITVSTTPPS